MKRMLFILAAAILGLTTLNAQSLEKRSFDAVKASEVQKALVSPQYVQGQGMTNAQDLVKKTNVYEMKAKSGKSITASTPAAFLEEVGTFAVLGVENWSGNMQWEVHVTKDPETANKYWFENLLNLPASGSELIYATLSNDVLTFTSGQKAFTNASGTEGIFSAFVDGYSDINVTAKIDLTEGKIKFDSGFGCPLGAGATTWFTIIKSATMYDPYFLPPMPGIEEMQGMLWMGWTNNFGGYMAAIACLPAYTTWDFKDATKKKDNISSRSWYAFEIAGVENNQYVGYEFTSTDENIQILAANHEYIGPEVELTTDAGISNIYRIGQATEKTASDGTTQLWPAYLYASGETQYINGEDVLYSNCNIDNSLMVHSSANFEYYGTGGQSKSLIAVYEAPLAGHLYFEGVQLFLGKVKGYSANTRFTVDVVKIHGWDRNEDEETGLIIDFPNFGPNYEATGEFDVIASSTATYAQAFTQVASGSAGLYGTLKFDKFEAEDEWGITVPIDYIETDHAFAFVFTGYNIPGASMGVYSATHDFMPEGKFLSFFVTPEDGISTWTDKPSPMAFSLIGGAYVYLQAEEDAINVDAAGGDVTVVLHTMRPDVKLNTKTLPEGVTIKSQVDNFGAPAEGEYYADYTSTITVSIAANAARTFDLTWHTPGAYETVTFYQGEDRAIDGAAANKEVNAVREGDVYRLTYPAAATAVSVYNVAGQRVAKYSLNNNGETTIPADKLTNGVYILKFEGINAAVKVLR